MCHVIRGARRGVLQEELATPKSIPDAGLPSRPLTWPPDKVRVIDQFARGYRMGDRRRLGLCGPKV